MFNEYHALLVHLGHAFCSKRNPKCAECPARGWNDE
jgi:endonuclease III